MNHIIHGVALATVVHTTTGTACALCTTSATRLAVFVLIVLLLVYLYNGTMNLEPAPIQIIQKTLGFTWPWHCTKFTFEKCDRRTG